MRLDIGDRRWVDTSTLQCLADDALLGWAIRGGEATAAPIMVDHRATNHGPDLVTRGLGIREALEHEDTTAFATAIAIGGRVKGLAAPIGGIHLLPAITIGRLGAIGAEGVEHQIDASGQGNGTFAAAQTLARLVDRHQRGRTRGIHRDGRPL